MTQVSTPVVAPVNGEPAFLTFLKEFAVSVCKTAQDIEFDGEVNFEVAKLGDNLQCIRFTCKTSEVNSTFNVFVGKRYYGNNMLRVQDSRKHVVVMQADPHLFLSYISF